MKISTDFNRSALLAFILLMAIGGCKSHEPKGDDARAGSTDTIAVSDTKDSVQQPLAVDTSKQQKPLTLVVTNLVSPYGPVIIGVYKPENDFLNEKDQFKLYKFVPKGETLTAQITDMGYGDYGLAIYQDVNSNGKIDKNAIGIPKEPYAFSNNYKPLVKAPAFKNCKFTYDETSADTVMMKMIR